MKVKVVLLNYEIYYVLWKWWKKKVEVMILILEKIEFKEKKCFDKGYYL